VGCRYDQGYLWRSEILITKEKSLEEQTLFKIYNCSAKTAFIFGISTISYYFKTNTIDTSKRKDAPHKQSALPSKSIKLLGIVTLTFFGNA
jgi:hypothetical protein